jgi:hypothetical protein
MKALILVIPAALVTVLVAWAAFVLLPAMTLRLEQLVP